MPALTVGLVERIFLEDCRQAGWHRTKNEEEPTLALYGVAVGTEEARYCGTHDT